MLYDFFLANTLTFFWYFLIPEDIIILHMPTIIGSTTDRILVNLFRFLPLYPPNNPKNQNFEKIKNIWRYYYFAHVCHQWQYDMMYGSWDRECNRQNFLSLWTIFHSFTPLANWIIKLFALPLSNLENQNFEKMKKTGDIIYTSFTHILHKCTETYDHTIYNSGYMVRNRQMDGKSYI